MAQATADSTATLSGGTSTKVDLVKRLALLLDDDAYTDRWVTGGNSSATTVDVASTTSPHEYELGTTLDFLEDGTYEAVLVTALPGTPNLTARRGHRGTTAATHAANAIFRVNPMFLSHVLGLLVDEAVLRMYPDIPEVKVATYTTPSAPADTWYALPADTEEVYSVYQVSTAGTLEELEFPATRSPSPVWTHAGFSATNKAIRIGHLDTNLANFYIVYGTRPVVTTLTSAQQDIVLYGAARRALEVWTGHRPSRQGERAIFGAEPKIQLFRREEKSLRDAEAIRLAQYQPRRNSLVWRNQRFYTEGL